ncbi:MAG: hypothetical protein GXY34_01550 [Syntrophomonadaceae bacterium]|nr:hypothetical protein [Syntrophomonadaceae bacterium]
MLGLILGINLLVLLMEAPALIKKRQYKDLSVFFALFAIGLYASLAFYYGWPLQEPFNALISHVAPND